MTWLSGLGESSKAIDEARFSCPRYTDDQHILVPATMIFNLLNSLHKAFFKHNDAEHSYTPNIRVQFRCHQLP
jgi:hypothetical protein